MKAKTKKDRDDATKAAEKELLYIRTDAETVLNAFMPYDDDEEDKKKVNPEEEYDGEKDGI